MQKFVAVVICVAAVTPASSLLRSASRASQLPVRRSVPIVVQPASKFDLAVTRQFDRDYPPALQAADDQLYAGLGLTSSDHAARATLLDAASAASARYDVTKHVVYVRSTPHAGRARLVNELVRALVDQNFGLKRMGTLRARDRDAALAAAGAVNGLASLASGVRTPAPTSGTLLDRFLATERDVGPGRALIARLRYLGGRSAVASALRTFPRTTEQLLHLDKFLEREPALPIQVPVQVADLTYTMSETFGELDVRALLGAFGISNSDVVADGWGGGRLALYRSTTDVPTTVLVLRWDTPEDADEWRAAAPRYVVAAFPGAVTHVCPAVDACWLEGDRELALGSSATTTVFASGPEAELIAASLIQASGSG